MHAPGVGLHFLAACRGTSPTAGTEYLHIQNAGGHDASKGFAGNLLQAGTYTVTFDIGNFSNAPFVLFDQLGLTSRRKLADCSAGVQPDAA